MSLRNFLRRYFLSPKEIEEALSRRVFVEGSLELPARRAYRHRADPEKRRRRKRVQASRRANRA